MRVSARGGYIGAPAVRGSVGTVNEDFPCAALLLRVLTCERRPQHMLEPVMAVKHPYTAERLRQKARASADGARGDHPTVADLSCEYLWPPLLSVSSVIVFFFNSRLDASAQVPRRPERGRRR